MAMQDIADMIENDCFTVQDVKPLHLHICREDHFYHAGHTAQVTELEEGWKKNYDCIEHQGLCALPAFAAEASLARLWMPPSVQQSADALSDGNRPSGCDIE